MAATLLDLSGHVGLKAALDKLSRTEVNATLRPAMRAALRPVLESAKGKIRDDTGTLKASLKIRAGKKSAAGPVMEVRCEDLSHKTPRAQRSIRKQQVARGNAFIGKTFYGAFVEYGHAVGKRATNVDVGEEAKKKHSQARAKRKAADSGRQQVPAYPFLRPAYDEHEAQIIQELTAVVGRMVDNAFSLAGD